MGLRDRLYRTAPRSRSNALNVHASEYLTPHEAAEITGIESSVIRRWMDAGRLQVYLRPKKGRCVSWFELHSRKERLQQEDEFKQRTKSRTGSHRGGSTSLSDQHAGAPTRKHRKRRRKKKREARVTEPFVKTVKPPKVIKITPGGAVSGPRDRERLILASMERRLAELDRKMSLTPEETRERLRLTAQIGEYRILIDRLTPPS